MTIITGIDFSDASGIVLRQAGEFARLTKARLVIVHAVEPPSAVPAVETAGLSVVPTVLPMDLDVVKKRLEEQAARQLTGFDCECRVEFGAAASVLLEAAKSENAGMIVIGSHGHGALYHLLAGSVVTGVLKRATCPILIVPIRVEAK